jgi:uncharacterized protein (DUF1778 family)
MLAEFVGLSEALPKPNFPNRSRIALALYGNLPYILAMSNAPNTTARLEARLPVDVHALLKRAAEIEGRTLTDFVVAAASAAARKTIEDAELLRLSAEDQQRFAEAMIEPPPLAPAMKRAVERQARLIGPARENG